MAMLKQVWFGLPPLKEQQQIADAIHPIDRKLAVEESRLSALGELFRSLLRDLMTGRVRVHDLGLAPAAAGT
jgi:type I restriction enzyme S subunit